jgi:hypothetical protein
MSRLRSKFVWTGIFVLGAVLLASARRLSHRDVRGKALRHRGHEA